MFNNIPEVTAFIILVFILYLFQIYYFTRIIPDLVEKATEGEQKFITVYCYKKKYEQDIGKKVPELKLDEFPRKFFGIEN
jgi:hypothetical protein